MPDAWMGLIRMPEDARALTAACLPCALCSPHPPPGPVSLPHRIPESSRAPAHDQDHGA